MTFTILLKRLLVLLVLASPTYVFAENKIPKGTFENTLHDAFFNVFLPLALHAVPYVIGSLVVAFFIKKIINKQ